MPSNSRRVHLAVLLATFFASACTAAPAIVSPSPSPVASPAIASPSSSPTPSLSPSPLALTSPSAALAGTACHGTDLAATVASWQGAAGSRFGVLQVSHAGATPCTVQGTPGVQLVDGQGHVFLDSAALGAPATVSTTDPVYPLSGGATSPLYITVGLSNYCGPAPAAPVTVALVLPTSLGRVVASLATGLTIDMAPCNGAGSPAVLHVQLPWSTTAP